LISTGRFSTVNQEKKFAWKTGVILPENFHLFLTFHEKFRGKKKILVFSPLFSRSNGKTLEGQIPGFLAVVRFSPVSTTPITTTILYIYYLYII